MNITMAQLRAKLRDVPNGARILGEPERPTRPTPALGVPKRPGLAALFAKLQTLAQAEGWESFDTYNALGEDAGLQCILVREAVLFVDLKEVGEPLTVLQQRWQEALRRAGQQEVYTWTIADWETMHARLTRTRP